MAYSFIKGYILLSKEVSLLFTIKLTYLAVLTIQARLQKISLCFNKNSNWFIILL